MMKVKTWIGFCKNHVLLFALGAFVVLTGVIVFNGNNQSGEVTDEYFHGPHFPNDQVANIAKADLPSAKQQSENSQPAHIAPSSPITISTSTIVISDNAPATSSAATTVASTTKNIPIVVAAPTSTPSSTPIPTPIPVAISPLSTGNGYGIAAGGGLTWLDQSDLDAYFQSLKDLGVTWVRWDLDWSAIQPDNPSSYDWDGPDRVAATAAKFGIQSLGIITIAPQWALDPNASCTIDQHCPPLDPNTYAHFASVVASRYKGVINTWEIWNEPNLNGQWATAANGEGYAAYLKAAYTAIKQANPSAIVLTGGLAAAADEGGNTSPTTFIRTLYAAGAKGYFDAIALHPYSYPVNASYIAPWNSWQQMTGIRQLMVDNGDSAKKIWVTEYGAPTGGPGSVKDLNQLVFTYGSDYMTESAQQQMLQDVMTLYSQDKSWMGPFFWYSLKDNGSDTSTPENFFGLIRFDGSQKPAYQTFKQIIASSTL